MLSPVLEEFRKKRAAAVSRTVTCLLVLLGVLYAGLAPFHAPPNAVQWISTFNGIQFHHLGTIRTNELIPVSTTGGRTLEFWAQPGTSVDGNTFLAFYDQAQPRGFSIHQSLADMALEIAPSSAWSRNKISRLYIDDAFRTKTNVFWAIAAGPTGISIYRDARLVRSTSKFTISPGEFSGRLVIGTSPIFDASWSGILRGLAIFDRELTSAQIQRHQTTWTLDGRPKLDSTDECRVLYLLNEHAGSIVHNTLGGNELTIPAVYSIVNQTLLDPVWRAFSWTRNFWADLFINFAGFVPFGCLFSAYFSNSGLARPRLIASIFSAGISLLIEICQSHLPTRDSSMCDVIANSAGAAVGAGLYSGAVAKLIDGTLNRVSAW